GRVQSQRQLADRREQPVVVDHLVGEERLAGALDLARHREHGHPVQVGRGHAVQHGRRPGAQRRKADPGRPDVIAVASAMTAAVPSRTADTTWMPRRLAASMKPTTDSPGYPNTWRTPAASR